MAIHVQLALEKHTRNFGKFREVMATDGEVDFPDQAMGTVTVALWALGRVGDPTDLVATLEPMPMEDPDDHTG